MNILVTLNSNYIAPLKVIFWSLFFDNPGQSFNIYLMHSFISEEKLDGLRRFVAANGQNLFMITVCEDCFEEAPVVMHYSKEMYYRLLAYKFLPAQLGRILYMDMDILVINPIGEFYDTEIVNYLYATAYHDRVLSWESTNSG